MKPLNPIMAVLVIAFAGALPRRTFAIDVASPAGKAVEIENKNSINSLNEILTKNPSAREDAGRRIADFLLNPDGSAKSFVSTDADRKALGDVALSWAKEQVVGKITLLYFVVGPGDAVLSWAKNDPLLSKTFLSKGELEKRLRIALGRFTVAGAAQVTDKKAATAFLNTAADEAEKVFKDQRPTPVIDQSVDQHNTTASQPPSTPESGLRLNAPIREYTLNDLYRDGAVVKDISGPKDENSSTISMKIYTKRMEDGTISHEIGIFDITDESDIVGQRFPIDSRDQSFILDDRIAGNKKYELKFGIADKNGNRTFTFARPDGAQKLVTSVSELFNKRAEQVATMSRDEKGGVYTVKVGDQDFYVLPQGGKNSGLALFSTALIDGRGTGDPRNLEAALYTEVGVRGPDGRNQNVPPGVLKGPHLGKLINGKEYHVEWNNKLAPPAWEVKDGPGNLPPPEKPTTDPGPTPGPGKPGGTSKTSGGAQSIADMELLLLQSPTCKKNPDDTKDLAAGLKGKYGIIACNKNTSDGLQQFILVPKGVRAAQQLIYQSFETDKLLRARFVDHYLVLEYEKHARYLDLLKQGKDEAGKENDFAMAGIVENKKAGGDKSRNFEDMGIFIDALRHYMGIAAGSPDARAFDAVPERAENLDGKPQSLMGGFANGALVVSAKMDAGGYDLWPTVRKWDQPDAKPNAYASLGGPGNAMDAEVVGSEDAPFPAKLALDKSHEAKPVAGRVLKDIALYESVDDPKKYFLMFKYHRLEPKPDGKTEKKISRQKQFEVFNAENYPGSGLKMQGLTAEAVVPVGPAAIYRFLSGTTKEKGVLAVFQNKQLSGEGQKNNVVNCVGPIVWWGLGDRAEALKACQEDKL